MAKPAVSPILIFGVLVVAALVVAILVVSVRFGINYRAIVDVPITTETNYQEAEFSVRKITLVDRITGERIEILASGEVRVSQNDQLSHRGLLSNSRLKDLFLKLSQEEFESLAKGYFSQDQNLSIIIETTQGTKTVDINNQQPPTQPPPVIDDIVDDIEDIESEVVTPTPTPPIIPTPTPPPPGSSPVPTPTPPPPTPTPGVTPAPSPTPDPFSCDQLNEHGVTVSNIRCLDPNQ